jgi:DNA ligase (NAD+)
VAASIHSFFSGESNRAIVERCLASGVTLENPSTLSESTPLEGKIFVFTGSLEKFTRSEAKEMVEHLGGRAGGSVIQKTDYLVAGPGAGSKRTKAEELGIPILTETAFFDLINR